MSKFPHHDKIATLNITSWAYCFNGEHYSARISHDSLKDDHHLEYPLSRKQALMLNKKDEYRTYSPGDMSTRFWTREDVYKYAIPWVQENLPQCKLLVDGNKTLDPETVVWCSDDKIGPQLTKIAEEFEAFFDGCDDPWPKHEDEMEVLSEKWWKLMLKLYGPEELIIFNTPLQGTIYYLIKEKPGEDPAFLAMQAGTNPQGFGRVAHYLMKRDLVYYNDGERYREWYPNSL